ncbi:MAG TPA: VWA domain-containing protein [Vicinamibacterales bacterium]|nr:VWA domain-containing protein [Vicinamibacterales bacterium]
MPVRPSRRYLNPIAASIAVVTVVGVVSARRQQPQSQQAPPVFKSGTIVVPLTVTVTDKNGAPVKDLKASDFTVIENKKTREIVNFFPQELAPDPGVVPAGILTPARVKESGIKPQTSRTFLIVLAYGRIEYPTAALEGAIDLVKNRLLPQDVVAVMGFHRTTAFTTDHARIAEILERYRREHEKLIGDINNYRFMSRGGPGQGTGGAAIPDKFLKRVDEIFLGPSTAGSPASATFLRNTADLLLGMDRVVPVVEKPGQHQETFGFLNRLLDESGDAMNDEVLLSTKLKLYAGVEYLRRFDGEKHMVFFSGLEGRGSLACTPYRPDGRGGRTLTMGGGCSGGVGRDVDEARILAQRASDARVVVDLITTTGTAPRGISGDEPGRVVTELTGGYYTSLETASKAVAKIDALTRFSYLLGYTPSNPDLDGTFRDVQVIVNRPDLTIRFRHGYFAAPEPEPLELEAMVKQARIETALSYDQQATDIPLNATATVLPKMGIQQQVRVEVTIDVAPLALALKDGVRTGQLELQIYCGDAKQNVVGDQGEHLDLEVPEATYQQWLQSGLFRTIRVPVSEPPKYVKVVVYDYGTDRVGSAMVTVK